MNDTSVSDSHELIDFYDERVRHVDFFGRLDALRRLDELLSSGNQHSGWVLVQGGPGLGKSALVSHWLGPLDSPRWPHHFIRRGVEDWDQPWRIATSLAAQVARRFAAPASPAAKPPDRLIQILRWVSAQVLRPRNERLILVVDGLDEAQAEGGANPLPCFLPAQLPVGVFVLCSSRPMYPHLSWLIARMGVQVLDLDGAQWQGSNQAATRAFWAQHGPRLDPPLDPEVTAASIERAEGNLLHAVRLLEWLRGQPAEARRAECIPRGMRGFLDLLWEQLRTLPTERKERVRQGLGLLCAAREALPLSTLASLAAWTAGDHPEEFLHDTRPLLYEQPAHWEGLAAYRLFHDSFREYIAEKLGPAQMAAHHLVLVRKLATWPPKRNIDRFGRRYALRHALAQNLAANDWATVDRLATDITYWEERWSEVGLGGIEAELALASERAQSVDQPQLAIARRVWESLLRALREESHWARHHPESLTSLLYNRLRCQGWTEAAIRSALNLVPSGSLQGLLRHPLQNASTPCVRMLTGHEGTVTACAVTRDGRRLVSASADCSLKIWDLSSGLLLATLRGHRGWVRACAVTPDGQRIVSASTDGTLKLWELQSGQLVATLAGHDGAVHACAVLPDGQRVVSGAVDGMLKVWDIERGHLLASLSGHQGCIMACAVMPDGKGVVSASADGTLIRWEVGNERPVVVMTGHEGVVLACAVTADGRHIVSGAADHTLKIWDAETGRLVASWAGHAHWVNACVALPTPTPSLVSVSEDSTVKRWDIRGRPALVNQIEHGGAVKACAVTTDGKRIISAGDDHIVKVWEVTNCMQPAAILSHEGAVRACAIDPNGKYVLSGSTDRTLKIWDALSGQPIGTLHGHKDEVRACAVMPDGGHVISGSADYTLKIWALPSGLLKTTLLGHKSTVLSCAVTPDSRRIVSTASDGTVALWDAQSGQVLTTMSDPTGAVRACAVMPDGASIISACQDGSLRVWDGCSGKRMATLRGHDVATLSCATMPDNKHVVSASVDHSLRVWDVERCRLVATLTGHQGWVRACGVTSDGRYIISASADRTIKVWDTKSEFRLLTTIYGVASFYSVAVKDRWLAAGDALGNIWILELSSMSPTSQPTLTGLPMDVPTGECVLRGTVPTRRTLRLMLTEILLGDSDLDAFCLDYFPKVHSRFSLGMDRQQKRNLLLEYAPLTDILLRLRQSHPDEVREREGLIEYEYA